MRELFFLPLDNVILPSNTVTADISHNSVKGFFATFYNCHICLPKDCFSWKTLLLWTIILAKLQYH